MAANYEEIKSYLLGKLGEAECERIDLQIIEDEEFAIEAQAAEDQLIEDYFDGELTEADVGLFRDEYLTTETRAERVKQFAALRAAAGRESTEFMSPVKKAKNPRPSYWSILTGLQPDAVLGAIAVIGLLVFGIWMLVSDGERGRLESEYAALNGVDKGDLSKFGSYTSLEVISGTLRSGSAATPRVSLSEASETILFRLPLNFEPPAGSVYRADLSNGGASIFSVEGLRPVRNGAVHEVRVLLPLRMIRQGQNQISLTADENSTSPIVYTFSADHLPPSVEPEDRQ